MIKTKEHRKTKGNIQKCASILFFIFFTAFFSTSSYAQELEARATVDSTKILIGQQINYNLEVLADEGEAVVFPEGQTFNPLEVIESYAVDTATSQSAKVRLIKRYGLTQFDSGRYVIPKQKILIGTRTVETDTFIVEVNNVVLDTVKQGLYDIKPVIELPKDYSDWWKYLLWIIPVALAIGLFLWWLLRRNKKQKEAERYVPPFERAIATLQELDHSDYVATARYKEYYSILTDTVRRYYDEKVYDRALESTTDELIDRLQMERDSGHISFSHQTIGKLKDIFKRADLVKFARVNPPEGKAQADRLAVEEIVKETKEALPEPTVEELMKQEDYREALSRKRNRKLWLTGIGGVLAILLLATGIGIAIKGYDDVRDFLLGNQTRELAEGNWITSEYGTPGMIVSTPKVLERVNIELPPELAGSLEITSFEWETTPTAIEISVAKTKFPKDAEVDPKELLQNQLTELEAEGFEVDIVKDEPIEISGFGTGVKLFGSGQMLLDKEKGTKMNAEYAFVTFGTENNEFFQLIIIWKEDDPYARDIAERVIASVDFRKEEK